MVANKDPFARSAPSQTRPRLSADIEEALEPTERRSAACYEHIENSASRFMRIAQRMREEEDCVPDDVESEESLGIHIREAIGKIAERG